MSIEGQGHFLTIYFPGFVCFVLYSSKISGERLQDHWLIYSSCYMYELKTFCILDFFFFMFLFHFNRAKLFSTDTLADLSLH